MRMVQLLVWGAVRSQITLSGNYEQYPPYLLPRLELSDGIDTDSTVVIFKTNSVENLAPRDL